jgi:RHS repeat-associated protein
VGGETYTFDAENRMTKIASYPTTTSYLYDGQGNLAVRRTAASPRTSAIDDRTVYVGGIYEERSEYGVGINAKATVQYQALGRVIATRTGTETTYLLADHLGSTVGTVSADGNEVHQVRYWPYGAVRSGGVGTDKMYTGQQMEARSALGAYFYHARFYSTTLGHFLSADVFDRGLNRYSYVGYNPQSRTDPSGHRCADWPPDLEDCASGPAEAAASAIVDLVRFVQPLTDATIDALDGFIRNSAARDAIRATYLSRSVFLRQIESEIFSSFDSTAGIPLNFETGYVLKGSDVDLSFDVRVVTGCVTSLCLNSLFIHISVIVVGHTIITSHTEAWIREHYNQWLVMLQQALDRVGEYEDLGDVWLGHLADAYFSYLANKPSACGFDVSICLRFHADDIKMTPEVFPAMIALIEGLGLRDAPSSQGQ